MEKAVRTINRYACFLAATFIILKAFGWLNMSWLCAALPLLIYTGIRLAVLLVMVVLVIIDKTRRR